MYQFLKKAILPVFWIGLGVLIGVVGGAGFGLTAQDSSRFAGSMLGSFVAVSGAFSLHFFKNGEDERKRREHLKELILQLAGFNRGIAQQLDVGENQKISSSLRVTNRFLLRCKRFCEEHEADDHRISLVGGFLENMADDHYNRHINEIYSQESKASLLEISKSREKIYQDALKLLMDGKL